MKRPKKEPVPVTAGGIVIQQGACLTCELEHLELHATGTKAVMDQLNQVLTQAVAEWAHGQKLSTTEAELAAMPPVTGRAQ